MTSGKMKPRYFLKSILVGILCAFMLAGCGGEESPENSNGNDPGGSGPGGSGPGGSGPGGSGPGGSDTTPDPYVFTAVTDVPVDSIAQSNAIVVSGINSAAPVSVSNGEYSIDGGAFTSQSGTVHNGDTVVIRHTTAETYSTSVQSSLVIGGVSSVFTSTTEIGLQAGIIATYPIGGLRYVASPSGHEGVTDATGAFSYVFGDSVKFLVGDIVLGEVNGTSQTDLLEIAGAAQPTQDELIAYMTHVENDLNKVSDLPIKRLLNMTMLLQALDADGETQAGVEVDAAAASDLKNRNHALVFSHDRLLFTLRLRKILLQSNVARAIPSPLNVIRELINSELLTTTLYARNSRMQSGFSGHSEYRYDLSGNLVGIDEFGSANSGTTPDFTENFTYDADGRMTLSSKPAGTGYTRNSYVYDADGNLVFWERDLDGDPATPNSTWTYDYDAFGNQLSLVIDDGDPATPVLTDIETYDAFGNWIRKERFSGSGGAPTFIAARQYDADGKETRYELDQDADGVVERYDATTYDENGYAVNFESWSWSYNNRPSNTSYISNDAFGNVVRRDYDRQTDGGIDLITTVSYLPNGDPLRYETLDTQLGTVVFRETYTYDAAGHVRRYEYDQDGDASPATRIETYVYDAAGNRISETIDDGATSYTLTYTYAESEVFAWPIPE